MTLLVAGILLFVLIHLVPSVPPLRQRLVARLGELPWRGLFSLVAVAGLFLVGKGYGSSPHVPLWEPPAWAPEAAVHVMPLAFVLLAAAYTPGHIRTWLRHPMLIAVVIWAILHLLANGDLASLILFGGFGAFALLAIASTETRNAVVTPKSSRLAMDAVAVIVGLVAYGTFLWAHPRLFGVPALT